MKAGVICTASIIYKQLGHGEISVTLYPRHYGHDLDVAQLRLSKEDKHVILAEVSEGKSPSDIADKLSLSAGLRGT